MSKPEPKVDIIASPISDSDETAWVSNRPAALINLTIVLPDANDSKMQIMVCHWLIPNFPKLTSDSPLSRFLLKNRSMRSDNQSLILLRRSSTLAFISNSMARRSTISSLLPKFLSLAPHPNFTSFKILIPRKKLGFTSSEFGNLSAPLETDATPPRVYFQGFPFSKLWQPKPKVATRSLPRSHLSRTTTSRLCLHSLS
jgi:hypothetical protein